MPEIISKDWQHHTPIISVLQIGSLGTVLSDCDVNLCSVLERAAPSLYRFLFVVNYVEFAFLYYSEESWRGLFYFILLSTTWGRVL